MFSDYVIDIKHLSFKVQNLLLLTHYSSSPAPIYNFIILPQTPQVISHTIIYTLKYKIYYLHLNS